MKAILNKLFFILLLFANTSIWAQGNFSISGTVFDENKTPVKGATVFISGSEKITATNEAGGFTFGNIDPGTYQFSVKMLGYAPYAQNVIIKESVNIVIALKVKPNVLNEVVIGSNNDHKTNYQVFKQAFLGTSKNAKNCEIINPEILSFSTKRNLLLAEADDFLIIENKRLGYRIRYLLKDFQYDAASTIALYDGETNFEQLQGTAKAKKEWTKNRLDIYKGSFMHFLRSVYNNTTLKEGFVTYALYKKNAGPISFNTVTRIHVDARPVKFDTLVNLLDTSFISLKFKQLYVTYDPKKAASGKPNQSDVIQKTIQVDEKSSIIVLYLKEAIIDRKGSYTDYRDFFIEGNWGNKRVGDQLPFEYQPPK
jgi:hypothetical protein